MTLETHNVRRTAVTKVAGDVQSIYEQAATTKRRRALAGHLAKIIAHLWAEDANAGRASAHFRDVGDDRLRQELMRLTQLGAQSDVAEETNQIHQPTILALADFGFVGVQQAGQDDRLRVVEAARKALAARAYVRPKTRPSKARNIQPTIKGAPANNRATAARRMLALHYETLTGKKPTMTGANASYRTPAGGAFLEFTALVLNALNIKASAEAQARAAVYPRNPKMRAKMSKQDL